MMYEPDNWVVIKINSPTLGPFYKLVAGWSGGYLSGNSWRINSGISSVTIEGDYYLIKGISGSVYKCHRNSEEIRMNIAGILSQALEKEHVEIVDLSSTYFITNEENENEYTH